MLTRARTGLRSFRDNGYTISAPAYRRIAYVALGSLAIIVLYQLARPSSGQSAY